jgi:energy-coupling factor transport system permease protein
MRPFADYHPLPQFLYFLTVSILAACFVHPYTALLSLLGALTLWFVRNTTRHLRSHLGYLALFLLITLINPLFRHSGKTVLFFLNHNPVTLQALLYGACSATVLISVLYWFRTFSQIMSADKLLYLFARLSPRLGLIVSMALRYVPLFSRQSRRVQTVQRMLQGGREDTLIDRSRSAARTVSVMTTWALERGVITADSMVARGYGVGKRTDYHLFRMHKDDILLLLATLLLGGTVILGAAGGCFDTTWYPTIHLPTPTVMHTVSTVAYGILAFIPCILEIGGKLRWHTIQSKI